MSLTDWLQLATAALGALGVYAVPNTLPEDYPAAVA